MVKIIILSLILVLVTLGYYSAVSLPFIPAIFYKNFCYFFIFPVLVAMFVWIIRTIDFFPSSLTTSSRYYRLSNNLVSNFMIVIGVPFLLSMFLMYLPAIPTHFYAEQTFAHRVIMINILCHGYYEYTDINFLDANKNQIYAVRFGEDLCKSINNFYDYQGNNVILTTKESWFGMYIEKFSVLSKS